MLSEVAKLCQTMVRIPSVNPQAKTAFQPPYGEQQMARFVCNWLNEHHLDGQIQTVAPNRPNVLAVAPGQNPAKTLLLCAHLDTVDVRDMTIEPFIGQARDGRILGRGSSDDKGPLAAMMIAFRDRVHKDNLPHNLALLATCGEEFDRTGSDFFATQLSHHTNSPLPGKLAAAIFAEPTNLKVIFAHRGVVRLLLTTQGKSAHSSRPEKGKNAIYPMARAVTAVENFAAELAHRPPHPQLGLETASVTVLHGGQQVNVVPDSCTAQVDWRILPGRDAQQCRDELNLFLKNQLHDDIAVELINQYDPVDNDLEHNIIAALLDAAEAVTGRREKAVFAGATDASAFTRWNIPKIIFGPGSLHTAHTQDEYIEIDKLDQGLTAYQKFLNGNWGIDE